MGQLLIIEIVLFRSFKTSYRLEMRTRLVEEECDDVKMHELAQKTNLLDALHLMAMSWTNSDESSLNFNHGVFSKEPIEMPSDLSEEVSILLSTFYFN